MELPLIATAQRRTYIACILYKKRLGGRADSFTYLRSAAVVFVAEVAFPEGGLQSHAAAVHASFFAKTPTSIARWPAPSLSCLATSRGARRLLFSAVFFVAAVGCGTKVIGLRSDPSLTYESLSTGGIVVGGVTSLPDKAETAATRSQMASLLRLSILKERPDIDVQPTGVIIRALGQESYAELLEDYRLAGDLDQARLAQLSEVLSDLRYVIFARIEDDVMDRSTTVERDTTADVDVTKYVTSRTVTTGFQIYDLAAGVPVWAGYIKKKQENENRYREGGDFVTILLEGLLRGEPEYPNPPALNGVARKTFEGFAENLPKRSQR